VRLALTLLGLDLFTLEIGTDPDNGLDPGDATSEHHDSTGPTSLGFVCPSTEDDE
jgi:hypothetical protein